MGEKVTIYDLAKALQLSPATISRSLNDHPSISKKTKDRVLLMAKESGYRTNKFAANLSKQKSNTIGVIVPKLNSNFMSTVLSGIEQVANDNGYNLIISQSFESEEKEKLNAKTLFDSGVDALLVSLAYETNSHEHFKVFTDRKIPLLFFDRVYELPGCPIILINNEVAGYDATQHLIKQGCKNILHVTGSLKRNVYSDRLNGYKRALKENGLKVDKKKILEVDLNPDKADFVVDFIKNSEDNIDGIFISNDTFAVHCIKKLKKNGFKIPKDIKVIGFNNDPVSKVISPSLSTIKYPGYEMGVLAGQSIISHLKGNIDLLPANSIILNHKLIIRESTEKRS